MQTADSPAARDRALAAADVPASGFGPRDACNYLLQLCSLAIFFGCGLLVTLVSVPLRLVLDADRGRRLGNAMLGGLFRFYVWWLRFSGLFRVEFDGLDRLESLSGAIVAPNHPGLLDAVFLMSVLPRPVCIMRAGLMRNPAFSGAARLAGYITNDRGPGLIRQCCEKIQAGDNLLIFPEGTRTRWAARGVNAFKSGFALASVSTGAPIHTVLIERSGCYLGKETSLFAAARIPIRLKIRLGEVFHPQPGESAKALSKRLEAYFRSKLEVSSEGVFVK